MKTTKSKLKKYSALALALAIATPISAFAGSVENDTEPSPTIISEETKEKTSHSLISNVDLSLAEEASKTTYKLEVSGLENPIKGHIYLGNSSNLENIKISKGDKDLEISKDKEQLTFDLTEDGIYTITADIKNEATSKLFFDLGLVDPEANTLETKRISSYIEEKDGAKALKRLETSRVESVLTGTKNDDNTIVWSDILLNNSPSPVKTNYPLNLNNTQPLDGAKLDLGYYQLGANGFEKVDSQSLPLGDINDLVIPANGFVTINFKTQIIDTNKVALARGVEAKEAYKTNLELAAEINNVTKQIESELIKNEEKISKGLDTDKEADKSTDDQNQASVDDSASKESSKVSEEKPSEVKVEKIDDIGLLTATINQTTDKLANTLIENDKNIAKDSKEEESDQESKDKATSTEVNDEAKVETPARKAETASQAEDTEEVEKEELATQTPDLKDIQEVKTIVLTENLDEDGAKYYTIELADELDIPTLTYNINLLSEQIANTLIENEKNQPASIMARASETNAIEEKPADKLESSSIIPASLVSERAKVDWLIREIQTVNSQIEALLKKSLNNDDRILNKIVEKAPTAVANKNSKDPATIKEVEKINAELTEVISQLDLALELEEVNSNEDEIEKIAALVDNLEYLEENSKKALEEVEEATNNQKIHNLIHARFPIVVDGFSNEVLTDFDKVVTVTLDPLTRPEVRTSKVDAANQYPKINEYLNRLGQRDDLLDENN